MVTFTFIVRRVRLILALLPLLTARKLANLLGAIFYFLTRSERSVAHPPILILTLTTDCNYSCIMCLRSCREGSTKGALMDYRNPREMDFDALAALLREHADHLCFVRLHGGEPLHYGAIGPLVRLLNELRIPFNVVTNGSLLGEELCDALVGGSCFGVGVSLDAADPRTYAHLRRGGDLDTVLAGVRRLNDLKRARGSRRPVLSASMCTFAQNAGEMADFVTLCADHGIRDVTVNEGWDYDTVEIRTDDLVAANRETVRLALEEAKRVARRRRVSLRVRFPALSDVAIAGVRRQRPLGKPRNCLNLYASAWLLPNFDLMGCSNATAPFGNIARHPLGEVWNGAGFGYVRARRCLSSHQVPTECEGCIYTRSFCT